MPLVPARFVAASRSAAGALAAAVWLLGSALAQGADPDAAQAPAPGGAAGSGHWRRTGVELLEREDPIGAWRAFQRIGLDEATPGVEDLVGLGRAHLLSGRSGEALRYAEAALRLEPRHQEAMALCVRALIRLRSFDAAVQRAESFERRVVPGAELLAAQGSALFRVQRIDEAAMAYRRTVALEPLHAEAHLRLGSGLLAPGPAPIGGELRRAVVLAGRGELAAAAAALQSVLQAAPDHAVAHRLLGEVLFQQRAEQSMANRDAAFAALRAALPGASAASLPAGVFVPGYAELAPARRAVVDRALATFARHLRKIVAAGATHDLLRELERTTDAEARAALRGKRTFDGRVWDDVRGVGGLQAATGIEALDEAAQFGFDTLVHEVAHQVHFFAFTPVQRARLKDLYQRALRDSRCLDYYAASNEAEYFGQGVEAFVALGKRPGGETTHGHTRFELLRVDPDLYEFVAGLLDADPLADPMRREAVLGACVQVALRCGRPEDALTAAALMSPGGERERSLLAARAALVLHRAW